MGSSCVSGKKGKQQQQESSVNNVKGSPISKASTAINSNYGCQSSRLEETTGFPKYPKSDEPLESNPQTSHQRHNHNNNHHQKNQQEQEQFGELKIRKSLNVPSVNLHILKYKKEDARTGSSLLNCPSRISNPSITGVSTTNSSGRTFSDEKFSISSLPVVKERSSSNSSSKLEQFIVERKKYMQKRGVFSYTAQTVLPPPVLKSISTSTIKRKRFASIPDILSPNTMPCMVRKESSPADMPAGDTDHIMIEI